MSEIQRKNKDSKELSVSESISSELLNPTFDLTQDYTELFIDDLIENETLRDVPVVRTIVGVGKMGIAINNIFFVKKLLTFIRELHNSSIDPKKLAEFKTKFNEDKKFRKKTTEQIMIFNERFIAVEKSKISARLFQAAIEQKITYEDFYNLNVSLIQLHPSSFLFLKRMEDDKFEIDGEKETNKTRNWDAEALLLSSGIAAETSSWSHGFRITEEGKKLYEFGLKGLL